MQPMVLWTATQCHSSIHTSTLLWTITMGDIPKTCAAHWIQIWIKCDLLLLWLLYAVFSLYPDSSLPVLMGISQPKNQFNIHFFKIKINIFFSLSVITIYIELLYHKFQMQYFLQCFCTAVNCWISIVFLYIHRKHKKNLHARINERMNATEQIIIKFLNYFRSVWRIY